MKRPAGERLFFGPRNTLKTLKRHERNLVFLVFLVDKNRLFAVLTNQIQSKNAVHERIAAPVNYRAELGLWLLFMSFFPIFMRPSTVIFARKKYFFS
ncbi:MAG: hypothetical protein JSS81_20565 [Acidobacteria bacterium]|nr:hypothetical protein [Acidobacteriota bacterium]